MLMNSATPTELELARKKLLQQANKILDSSAKLALPDAQTVSVLLNTYRDLSPEWNQGSLVPRFGTTIQQC